MSKMHGQQKIPDKKAGFVKVSVVIPVYHVEDYVEECLQSVMGQSLQELEIICINDGSTDDSWRKVQKLADKDFRMILFQNQENKGLSYTRNRGLNKARGKYVYFLDSDDMIQADALLCLYEEAENKNLDVILFDAELIYESPKYVGEYQNYLAIREGSYAGIKQGRKLLSEFLNNHEWSPSVPRQFWRKNFLRDNNLYFYEGIIHEDELFSLKALYLAEKAMFLPRSLFKRRFREHSIMTGRDLKKSLVGYFTVYYRMNQYIHQTGMQMESMVVYLAQIYEKVVRMYHQCSKKSVLAEEFLDEEVKNAFYFFESVQNVYKAYGQISKKNIDIIKNSKCVYIFGAGIIAKFVFEKLAKEGLIIHGFIVSSLKENESAYMGRPVIEWRQVEQGQKEMFIVIAVGKKYQKEIQMKLCMAGIKNIIYDETVE